MTIYYDSTKKHLSDEQVKEQIAEAKKRPIVFDDDCPELSPAMEKAFRSAAKIRNRKQIAAG